ncbi:MAG: YaaA family protein [Acholeplasmataceae bacterium]|nr:YaaA family protein [Acholeplasmataceae bacterium]
MITLLSPAKTFSKIKVESAQVPYFQNEALSLIESLQKIDGSYLMKSMKLSKNLALDVKNYYQSFGDQKLSAIHTYDGQAFKGLNAHQADLNLLNLMNSRLYILSGLYGILKPLDGISYYRLEMRDQTIKNLYTFWKKRIAHYLDEFHKDELFINLASSEYSKVLPKNLNMISIDFMQQQNGKYKSISMFVKKMRGTMARYLIEHQIKDIEMIKDIVIEGYRYDSNLSKNQLLIFVKEE